MSRKNIHILLVEDDDVDVMAVKRTFKKLEITNPIVNAKDGIEALDLLRGQNGKVAIPQPYLILLDLNLPRMSGLEFLDQIRNDPDHKSAIIFILSTSCSEADKKASYERNVAGYIVKSNIDDGYLNAIEMIDHYCRVIEFP